MTLQTLPTVYITCLVICPDTGTNVQVIYSYCDGYAETIACLHECGERPLDLMSQSLN